VSLVPDIPLVIKLHIPSFLIKRINTPESPWTAKVRPFLGALRRGINPLQPSYNPQTDPEFLHALDADEIVILTQSMAQKVLKDWELDRAKICQIPNPYLPSARLLDIPVETQTQVVTFIGRLETRKGVIDLAKAIPIVLRQCPDVRFRFVGRSDLSPNPELTMRQYLEHLLGKDIQSVEFTDRVPLDDIPMILASTDICVFPSIWENFPNVCLEAMAAARGVIGSCAGGMAEMLGGGTAGRLVPPRSPKKIARAIAELVEDPALRMQLGQAARQRVLTEYCSDRIGVLLERSYARAIARRRASGKRNQALAAFAEV
jgi:glycogen synthase